MNTPFAFLTNGTNNCDRCEVKCRLECFYLFFYSSPSRHRPEFPDSGSHPRRFSWRRALRHERPQPELPHQGHVRRKMHGKTSEAVVWKKTRVLCLALDVLPLLFAGPSPKLQSSLRSTKRSLTTKRYDEAAVKQTLLNNTNLPLIRYLQSAVWSFLKGLHLVHLINLCSNL